MAFSVFIVVKELHLVFYLPFNTHTHIHIHTHTHIHMVVATTTTAFQTTTLRKQDKREPLNNIMIQHLFSLTSLSLSFSLSFPVVPLSIICNRLFQFPLPLSNINIFCLFSFTKDFSYYIENIEKKVYLLFRSFISFYQKNCVF